MRHFFFFLLVVLASTTTWADDHTYSFPAFSKARFIGMSFMYEASSQNEILKKRKTITPMVKNVAESLGTIKGRLTYESRRDEGSELETIHVGVITNGQKKVVVTDELRKMLTYYGIQETKLDGSYLGDGIFIAWSLNQKPTVLRMPTDNTSPGAGWSNETGYRHAETPVQKEILKAIPSAEVSDSPESITGSPWFTDASQGDGLRMRNAIQDVYDYWVGGGRPELPFVKPLPLPVQNKMRERLSGSYGVTEQDAFIGQIETHFNGTVPKTDNETLKYLRIRAQCKEFADQMVLAGGGKPKTYMESAVPGKDVRPGMYAFTKDRKSHSAIVVAVLWDSNGLPLKLRLAESNLCGSTDVPAGVPPCNVWLNPAGQVPWKRVVTTTREVPYSKFDVVSTE